MAQDYYSGSKCYIAVTGAASGSGDYLVEVMLTV